MWYTAGWNMPGTLPETDPILTESLEEAYQHLIDGIRDVVQSGEGDIDDVYIVSLDAAYQELSRLFLSDIPEVYVTVLRPYVYWIHQWAEKPEV